MPPLATFSMEGSNTRSKTCHDHCYHDFDTDNDNDFLLLCQDDDVDEVADWFARA